MSKLTFTQLIIRLPVFFFGIGIFWFSFPILVLLNRLKWYDFSNDRGDSFIW